MVLGIRANSRVRLNHPTQLGLPFAIQDNPVDVAPVLACLPPGRFRSVEINVSSRASWVIGIKYSLDRSLAFERRSNRRSDPFTGHVSQHLVFQLGRISFTFANQIVLKPFP